MLKRLILCGLLIALAGCTNNGTAPPPLVGTNNPPPGPGSTFLMVTNASDVEAAVAGFLVGDNGDTVPQFTIIGSNTQLETPVAVVRDSSGNIYVGDNLDITDNCTARVVIFDRTASGNAFPSAVIGGPTLSTLDDSIGGIAIDASNKIYVTQDNNLATPCSPLSAQLDARVTIFGPVGPTGDVGPSSFITGPTTTLVEPRQLALDSSNNVWVADGDNATILRFTAGATGNVAPSRTITGNPALQEPYGVAIDSAGKIYVTDLEATGGPAVYVYAANANGAAVPVQTIQGVSTTLTADMKTLAVDGSNIYVADPGGNGTNGIIDVFSKSANGNVAPVRTITNTSIPIEHPVGVSL